MSIILPPSGRDAQAEGDVPTSVYRYYDVNDVLLYVGVTGRGLSRNSEHNRSKDWWPYVTRQTVDHFPSRGLALDRERSLIIKWTPPFNRQHNPQHKVMRAAYLHLVETGSFPSLRPAKESPEAKRELKEAQRLLTLHSKRLPLDGIGITSTGKYLFRTRPEHAFLAERLVLPKCLGLAHWGRDYAVLQSIEQTLGGAVFQVRSPVRISPKDAAVRLKWVEQKPPSFTVDKMTLGWLPTQSLERAA